MADISKTTAEAENSVCGFKSVPPSSVQNELNKIWRQTADLDFQREKVKSGEAAPRVRAILSNLIILVSEKNYADHKANIERLITEMCVSHPSRFFVVLYRPNSEKSSQSHTLSTAVSSRCVLSNSQAHVCSEEIYISAKGSGVLSVSHLLLSLLVPDVTTTLLVFGDFDAEGRQAEELTKSGVVTEESFLGLVAGIQKQCDRVIYDSGTFTDFYLSEKVLWTLNPIPSAEILAKPYTAFQRLRDSNWSRLKRWRSLVAEQFDSTLFADGLTDISSIKLYSTATEKEIKSGNLPAETILLAGWFFKSLGINSIKLTKTGSDAPVAIACEGVTGSAPLLEFFVAPPEMISKRKATRQLVGVKVTLLSSGMPAHFSLVRRAGESFAQITAEFRSGKSAETGSCDFMARKVPFPSESLENIVRADIVSYGETDELRQVTTQALTICELLSSLKGGA